MRGLKSNIGEILSEIYKLSEYKSEISDSDDADFESQDEVLASDIRAPHYTNKSKLNFDNYILYVFPQSTRLLLLVTFPPDFSQADFLLDLNDSSALLYIKPLINFYISI